MSYPCFLVRARMLSLVVAGLGLTSLCPASLLIYEGFNYTAGNTLSTIKPNASTVGFNTSVAYAGTGVANYTVQASSLSFGALQTTGGSVSFGTGTSVASGKLTLASPYTGTLWSSYLVSLTTQGSGAGEGALLRISSNTANVGERFNSFADSRTNSTNVAVGYDATSTATGNSLTLLTTYIIISKFTNVGTGLSAGTPGQSSTWALTEAQFANFLLGGATESYLNSATITGTSAGISARGSDASVTTSTYSLATDSYAALVSVNDTGTFDELRYGTTLADVTPIPEPATVGLVAGIGILLLAARRKRRA
ncbi:MAG TPA: PEP-CTERM sorting domain-containing protein [Rariglobus sp.]